jgi:hypothetical protein
MKLFEDKTDEQLEHFKDVVLYALAMVEAEIQRRKTKKISKKYLT